MTRHIYSIGQQVSFDGRVRTYLKPAGVFTVTKLLPRWAWNCNIASKVNVKPTNASRSSMNSRSRSWQSRTLQLDSRLSSVNVTGLSNNNRDRPCDQLGVSGLCG